MRFNASILKRVLGHEAPKPLGRWGIVSCATEINKKIDLANEDHCGPCGQYNIPKQNDITYSVYDGLSLEEQEILYAADSLQGGRLF